MLSNKNIQISSLLQAIVVVGCIGCCCCWSLPMRKLIEQDPLLAIASENYENAELEQASPASRYVEESSQAVAQQPGEELGEQKYRQEVYYVVDPPASQQAEHGQPQPQEYSPNLQANEEAETPATGVREYPGEIVYVGQEPQAIQNEPDSVSGFMEMISRSGSLPATILTEVPVSQLPEHVLEKLKREYGVKVVATRESPDANLVINCDDYTTGQESSFCQKPTSTDDTATNPDPSSPQDPEKSSPNENTNSAQSYYYPQEEGSPVRSDSTSGDTSGDDQAEYGNRNSQT